MKWICTDCAAARGLSIPPEDQVTWHHGVCETCRQRADVTDVMNFFHHTGADLPVDRGTKP